MGMTKQQRIVKPNGRTTCCNAYSTFMDDGTGEWVECCKACYEPVISTQGAYIYRVPRKA